MKYTRLAVIMLFIATALHAQKATPEGATETTKTDEDKVFMSKEIIVKDKKEQPGVVSIITDKEVKNSTKTNLVNVISQNVPSFYTGNNRVMGFGVSSSGAAVMSIRGVGKSGWGPTTGVPFLINGLDTTTSIMGHPIADLFAMKNIDRVEVLHGPQPVLYGSGALGGVVNVITKRQEHDGYSTELSGSYGSYNSTDDYITHQGKMGIFDYGVSYNFQRTDGHREQTAPNGKEVDSEYMNHNGTARFGFELGKNWYAGVNAFMMKQEIHDPGAEGKPYDALEYFDILRKGASLNVLNTYEKLEGMIHVFYNNGHHEAEQYPNDVDSYEHDDTLYGARVIESAKLFKGNRITVGMDVRKWGGTSKNLVTDVYYVKDKYLTDTSAFGLVEQRFFDAVTLSGGARYTDDSKFGGFTAWQGGLIVNPTEYFKIHSSVAKGFKLPDVRQLYIRNMGPSPNENLDPETYLSYDAGIELTPIKDIIFDITGYHIIADDKIIASAGQWTNADEFNYNGLEATAKYTIMNMVGLRTGYSYIDNEYRKAKLTYVPKHKLLGGVSFDGYGIYAGLDAEYVYGIWHDAAGTIDLSNYLVLNAKLAYTFMERYRAFVNLNNITDKDYSTYYGGSSAVANQGYYPMPGFTAMGGLSVTL
ncbi:MAG TPA: TonB-dependent receptor [Spirochaetota bacterium]|nr:TonB-dependent receptor [Spirochaetota bacterium]